MIKLAVVGLGKMGLSHHAMINAIRTSKSSASATLPATFSGY